MDTRRPTPTQSVDRPAMGLGPAWMKPEPRPRLTPEGQALGGRRRRVVAYLVDVIVLIVIIGAIRIALGPPLDRVPDPPVAFAYLVLDACVLLAYQVGLWTGGRSTVGMRLLGIRVVAVEDGGPVGVRAGLARWAVLEGVNQLLAVVSLVAVALAFGTADTVITLLSVGWPLLLLATMVRDDRRQGLHDRIARTYVVRR